MIVFTVKVSFRYVAFEAPGVPIGIDVRLIAARPCGGLLGIDFGASTGLGRVALTAGKLQLPERLPRC